MKCTECGTKCVKIEIDSTSEVTSYQCPSCCNTFEKKVKAKKEAATAWPIDSVDLGREERRNDGGYGT